MTQNLEQEEMEKFNGIENKEPCMATTATTHTQVKTNKNLRNIFVIHVTREIIPLIREELLEIDKKQIANPTEKWAKDMINNFAVKRNSSRSSTDEKMLSFIHNLFHDHPELAVLWETLSRTG